MSTAMIGLFLNACVQTLIMVAVVMLQRRVGGLAIGRDFINYRQKSFIAASALE